MWWEHFRLALDGRSSQEIFVVNPPLLNAPKEWTDLEVLLRNKADQTEEHSTLSQAYRISGTRGLTVPGLFMWSWGPNSGPHVYTIP